jgi:sporulation protein YlmC with PRC-barrel domain
VERSEVLRSRELIGWSVTDPDGTGVGTVTELLLGRDGRVRFLAVKRGMLGSSILIPADELTWGDDAMRLSRWSADEAKALPAWDADTPLSGDLLEEMARAHPRHYGTPPQWDAPSAAEGERIVPLSEARDFRLPKDAVDPRGWVVFAADRERLGTVAGMLVDPRELKVRYLDVDVADDLYRLKEDRHVVVPMEAVQLRERGRDAWVGGLSAREVARLPAYTGGPLDPLVATAVAEAFAGVSTPREEDAIVEPPVEDGIGAEHEAEPRDTGP